VFINLPNFSGAFSSKFLKFQLKKVPGRRPGVTRQKITTGALVKIFVDVLYHWYKFHVPAFSRTRNVKF
jgi:hypothetical protein